MISLTTTVPSGRVHVILRRMRRAPGSASNFFFGTTAGSIHGVPSDVALLPSVLHDNDMATDMQRNRCSLLWLIHAHCKSTCHVVVAVFCVTHFPSVNLVWLSVDGV